MKQRQKVFDVSASAGPERDQGVPSSLRVFINYRREDSADAAGRLYDSLSAHFANVFMDIDTIEPGVDFVDVVHDAVGSCDVLLALIGRHWLSAADTRGRRRLDEPNDFVGLEIKAALDRDVRVIPVLLQGAEMPGTEDLPASLQKLARRNAFEVSQNRWRYDVGRLIDVLEGIASQKLPAEGMDTSRPIARFEDTASSHPGAEEPGSHGRTAQGTERAGVEENEHRRRSGWDRRKAVAGVVAAVLVISVVGVVGWNATRSVDGSPSQSQSQSQRQSQSPSSGMCSPVPGASDACPAAQLSGTYVVRLTPVVLPSTASLKPKNKIWGSKNPDGGDTDSWSGQKWYFTPGPATVVWTVEERTDVKGHLQRGGVFVDIADAHCGTVNHRDIVTRRLEFTEASPETIVGTLSIDWVCPNPSLSVRAEFDVTGSLSS